MLRAELCALRNLVRTRDGRTALVANAIVLGCAAILSMGVTSGALLADEVLAAAQRDGSGRVVGALLGVVTAAPLLIALLFGGAAFRVTLFEAAQVPLLLTAPVSTFAVVCRGFLRHWAGWLVVAAVLGLPAALGLARAGVAAPLGAPVWLVAVALLLAPVVAVQLCVRVAAARWLSGPRWRALSTAVGVVTGLTVGLLALFGFTNADDLGAGLAEALARQDAPAFDLAQLAAWPVAVGGHAVAATGLWLPVAAAALAGLPLAAATAIYRAAVDVHGAAAGRPGRLLRRAARPWPADARGAFLRRAAIEMLRVRSSLAFYAVLFGLQLVLLTGAIAPRAEWEAQVPADVHAAFALLRRWYGVAAVLAALSILGIVGDEQKNAPLLATAPFERRHLLAARLVVVAVPQLLAIAAVTLCAPLLTNAGPGAAALFALGAAPIALVALGAIAACGTWPRFVRLHADVPLASNLRTVVPVLAIFLCVGAAIFAQLEARGWLRAASHAEGAAAAWSLLVWLLVGAWLVGAAVFALGVGLGRRNLESLLGPQDD